LRFENYVVLTRALKGRFEIAILVNQTLYAMQLPALLSDLTSELKYDRPSNRRDHLYARQGFVLWREMTGSRSQHLPPHFSLG
jgi:hypothetical protein